VTQANDSALQIIVDEFKNLSPEITFSFIFKKNGEIAACTQPTAQEQSNKLIEAFNNLSHHAQDIGGIQTLSIQGADSQLTITSMNNQYLAMGSTRAADDKIVKSLMNVIVPTVLKLADQAVPEHAVNILPEDNKPEEEPPTEISLQDEPAANNDSSPLVLAPINSEPPLPQPPASQFMVEKIGGLLVSSDTVRIDAEVIASWSDLYGDKQITDVYIQTLEGKSLSCKFKPLKESNQSAKGIIQIPEKILQTLQTSKGKLVIVKPVITQSPEEIDS
jgi:hypothetical protein